MLGSAALGQFALGQWPLDAPTIPHTEESRGKGGWDPHAYKSRNKRRKKKEDVQDFLLEVFGRKLEDAPEPVQVQAEEATQAAQEYLALSDTALQAEAQAKLTTALQEINAFYSAVRQSIKRQQAEDDEDEDLLLLHS